MKILSGLFLGKERKPGFPDFPYNATLQRCLQSHPLAEYVHTPQVLLYSVPSSSIVWWSGNKCICYKIEML